MGTIIIYTYKNKTGSLPCLCKKFNKNYSAIKIRMQRGMTIDEAFEKDIRI